MKKILLYTLGAMAISATFTLQSCDKIKDKVKDAVPAQDISFTGANADIVIPPTNDTTAQGTIGEVSFAYNLDSMVRAQTSGALGYADIKSVKITSLKLTLTDGSAANNFANFVYAGAAFNSDVNGGNYDPYTIAYVEHNPDNYSLEISPAVTDASQDVKKYFQSQMTFYYLLIGKLRRPITSTLHCHVEITYVINI